MSDKDKKMVDTTKINKDLGWKDISDEQWREYHFPYKDDLYIIRIEEPLAVAISDNGHRLYNRAGISYYIPKVYIAILWKGYEDGQVQYDW